MKKAQCSDAAFSGAGCQSKPGAIDDGLDPDATLLCSRTFLLEALLFDSLPCATCSTGIPAIVRSVRTLPRIAKEGVDSFDEPGSCGGCLHSGSHSTKFIRTWLYTSEQVSTGDSNQLYARLRAWSELANMCRWVLARPRDCVGRLRSSVVTGPAAEVPSSAHPHLSSLLSCQRIFAQRRATYLASYRDRKQMSLVVLSDEL